MIYFENSQIKNSPSISCLQVVVFTTDRGAFEAEIFVDKMPITAGCLLTVSKLSSWRLLFHPSESRKNTARHMILQMSDDSPFQLVLICGQDPLSQCRKLPVAGGGGFLRRHPLPSCHQGLHAPGLQTCSDFT